MANLRRMDRWTLSASTSGSSVRANGGPQPDARRAEAGVELLGKGSEPPPHQLGGLV